MSIKKKILIFLHFFQYSLTILILLIGFVFPDISFAWFCDNEEEFFLNQSISSDIEFSDTYVIYYNDVGQKRNIVISHYSKSQFCIVADQVNIDIPLNILSKNAIDPGESIDRLLAVNLRVRNILDEYAKLDNKADLILKDLSIPYLNRAIQKKSNWFVSSIQQKSISAMQTSLKKELVNAVNTSRSYKVNTAQKDPKIMDVLNRINKKASSSVSFNSVDLQSSDVALNPEFERLQRVSEISLTERSNEQQPWLFSFLLKVIKYCMDHKVGIIIFIILSLFFIALIPMRGRK